MDLFNRCEIAAAGENYKILPMRHQHRRLSATAMNNSFNAPRSVHATEFLTVFCTGRFPSAPSFACLFPCIVNYRGCRRDAILISSAVPVISR